jgi:hypothetical protein
MAQKETPGLRVYQRILKKTKQNYLHALTTQKSTSHHTPIAN